MKYVFVFVLGCLTYYYFPDMVETALEKAETAIHESAVAAADATKPNTIIDDLKEKLQ